MFLSKGDAEDVFKDATKDDGVENRNRENEKRDSSQALRLKMMSQHQAILQRKNSVGSSNNGMVMSTNFEPANPQTAQAQARGSFGNEMGSALCPSTNTWGSSIGFNRSNTAGSVNSFHNSDDGAAIAPLHEEAEADLEQRRRTLVDDLKSRGVAAVFDPSPTSQSIVNLTSGVDLRNLDREQVRHFLMNPLPKGAMLECRIKREKSGLSKFYPKFIFETDSGVFLAASKKQTKNKTSNYLITMDANSLNDKKSESFLGKVRSNFLGSEFTAYGPGENPKKVDGKDQYDPSMAKIREEMVAVEYSSSLFGKKPRGPRKMSVTMPSLNTRGERVVCKSADPQVDGLIALAERLNQDLSGRSTNANVTQYVNKPPKWNDQIGAFVLNFNKRVTQASVKNFQLIRNDDPDMVYLQCGRVLKDTFNIDFRYPVSPFQAFAIALTSFDYKLCCE